MGGHYKLGVVGHKKDHKGRQVTITTPVKRSGPCKTAGCKGQRQNGSSRCKQCSDAHRTQQINKQRLDRKIEQQLNSK